MFSRESVILYCLSILWGRGKVIHMAAMPATMHFGLRFLLLQPYLQHRSSPIDEPLQKPV